MFLIPLIERFHCLSTSPLKILQKFLSLRCAFNRRDPTCAVLNPQLRIWSEIADIFVQQSREQDENVAKCWVICSLSEHATTVGAGRRFHFEARLLREMVSARCPAGYAKSGARHQDAGGVGRAGQATTQKAMAKSLL